MDKQVYRGPTTTSVQNNQGQWVPAIPEPIRGVAGLAQCTHQESNHNSVPIICGRWFLSREAYRGHYALVHILHLD